MSHLHSMTPLTLTHGMNIKNRIFKSAMSESLGTHDHAPSAALETLYQAFALGGSGIVVTGNVMIDRRALGEPANVVLEDDRHMDAFKRWAQAGKQNNTSLWMQLNHPGKQSPMFLSKEPVAPSAIPLSGSYRRFFNTPRALTETEIQDLVNRFAKAAALAEKAGFHGVQIHAAHGYLISQFFSPIHNQRTDQYGGNIENRTRFLKDIFQAIKEHVSDSFGVGVKLNSQDFEEGGFSEDEALYVMKTLDQLGIDFIEISGGNYHKPVMSTGQQGENEAFFVSFAKILRPLIQVPMVITGGFRAVAVMEEALKEFEPAMIGMARPLALDPNLPNDIAKGTYQTANIQRLTTGFKFLDRRFGPILGNSYYELQMQRMAHGKKVKRTRNAWGPILHTAWVHGPKSLLKRRIKN